MGARGRRRSRIGPARPPYDGLDRPRGVGTVEAMDIPSMIMGASIASVAWIGFHPWAELKRLRAMEAAIQAPEGPGETP